MRPTATRSATKSAGRDTGELAPLSERLSLLMGVRILMGLSILVCSTALPHLNAGATAMRCAVVYMGLAIVTHYAHRWLTRLTAHRWIVFINLMLIVDGLFVGMIMASTGQARSAFAFLAYVHIISITLLLGFRTGLKMSLWHSICLLTSYYMQLAGLITFGQQIGTSTKITSDVQVAYALGLWLVAIATAVFGALNERELRRRKGELTIIADLASRIEQTRRPTEILQALQDAVTSKFYARRAITACVSGDTIMISGGEDSTPPYVRGETLLALGGVVERTVQAGAPVLVQKLNPSVDTVISKAMPNATNVSVIPMIAEGETIAVLIAEWGGNNKRRVTRPMIDLLSNVAGRVALSLSNTFLLAEVQRLASVDGLTNLPNRRTFNQAIEREVARAQRSGQPVSLVMLDIDNFKNVNDTYGHQTGDAVLAEAASGVLAACRNEDMPARYGGEEMAVIMPNCSVEQARVAAERIRRSLAAANVTLKGVTASAGVATFPNNAHDVSALLAAADEALYCSKENGRNRTTAASSVSTEIEVRQDVH